MQENKSNLVIYNDGELELKISLNNETIWLTQAQLSEILKKTKVLLADISIIFLKIMK